MKLLSSQLWSNVVPQLSGGQIVYLCSKERAGRPSNFALTNRKKIVQPVKALPTIRQLEVELEGPDMQPKKSRVTIILSKRTATTPLFELIQNER